MIALGALYWNGKMGGRLLGSLPRLGGSLDGTYVSGDLEVPMRITIKGDRADTDLWVIKGQGMRVERHGNTVSISGGRAYLADGSPIPEAERKRTGDVDLYTVGNDGQTLTLDFGEGRKAVFVKQP